MKSSAEAISFVAHTAKGQMRADGITRYFTHPRRVAELALEFRTMMSHLLDGRILRDAAFLHDVLEDTKLTREDLLHLGVEYDTVDVVERLTKKNGNEPATPEYYQGIAENDHALVVKCADRCSNLEDALSEVVSKHGLKRWRRYVEKTHDDVVPMYVAFPDLQNEIIKRLALIEKALIEFSRSEINYDDLPTVIGENRKEEDGREQCAECGCPQNSKHVRGYHAETCKAAKAICAHDCGREKFCTERCGHYDNFQDLKTYCGLPACRHGRDRNAKDYNKRLGHVMTWT